MSLFPIKKEVLYTKKGSAAYKTKTVPLFRKPDTKGTIKKLTDLIKLSLSHHLMHTLLLQTTIGHRNVQQQQILAVLIAAENVVHVGEVLVDSPVNHLRALILAIVSCKHHL